MMLPPANPLAASLTSSKLFLRSAISASRIASWNWPWNSPAILRALATHCPTMRRTPGNSLGPMAISATTAMTANSLQPISNIKASAHARPTSFIIETGPAASLFHRSCRHQIATPAYNAPGSSDRFAADIRPRRLRRSVVIDRLYRLALFDHLVVVLHALLEGLDALSDVTHQVGNFAAAEQQQDDSDHDDPVPNAQRTHPAILQNTRNAGPFGPELSFSERRLKRCRKQGLKPRKICVRRLTVNAQQGISHQAEATAWKPFLLASLLVSLIVPRIVALVGFRFDRGRQSP